MNVQVNDSGNFNKLDDEETLDTCSTTDDKRQVDEDESEGKPEYLKNTEGDDNTVLGEKTEERKEGNSTISNGGQEVLSMTNLDAATEVSSNEAVITENNDIPCDSAFEVRIVEAKLNSVCIDWTLMSDADVYKIEKYHRRHGWEQVAWVGYAPACIQNLAESFTYRLRIKAQHFCEERGYFEDYKMSPEFLVTTLSPLPTALSLHRAIKKGQQFLVKRILRRRLSLLEYPGPNGYLPLANAIINGQHSVIDVLLSHGANVHIGNPVNARTPLQLAFNHGRLAVARILLNRKAQLEATDINDMTACHFAVDVNHLELLGFALENGANVNATDACGWSLLSRAVVMGADVCVLKLLLLYGADAKSTDKLGKTCVDLARIYKNTDAANYFAKALRAK